MLSIVTIPSATSSIEAIGLVSSPWFTEFLSWIWFPVGISLAVGIVFLIIHSLAYLWGDMILKREYPSYDFKERKEIRHYLHHKYDDL